MTERVPIIDLFAGPGGLGEGFAAFCRSPGVPAYRIALSVEKEESAHRTLELRAFFRQFAPGEAPRGYYEHLSAPDALSRSELFGRYHHQAKQAQAEAWNAELGVVPETDLDRRVKAALGGAENWLLIGGPPCQAYSIVGRSRRGGMAADDPRIHLYREYLRILAVHRPPVFIMENVKGLLSAKLEGVSVFDRMLDDLSKPSFAAGLSSRSHAGNVEYRIHSLVQCPAAAGPRDPRDFIIQSERYGIPQTRHRVIMLGVRTDVRMTSSCRLKPGPGVSLSKVIGRLPRLRSGLSRQEDSKTSWKEAICLLRKSQWFRELRQLDGESLEKHIAGQIDEITLPHADRGAEFIHGEQKCDHRADWFIDSKLTGICNHHTRAHIVEDLHRYFFSAAFAARSGRSPTLKDFPPSLLPAHKNVDQALHDGHFCDRFRVQIGRLPSTTITSHMAKDGHYFIHYDPTQCRSLTVREAARIQTFPDNYLFCGSRSQQYLQVGNAVPPLLAYQIAEAVYPLVKG
ncbi:DNA cytosine methyltransferase [Schlesneria sp.]|uniref:DNA cytosine methyltransferase n=1 Tax=Schlesneria sp. TaxID=2762018 RepID=UPI002F24DB5A